MFRLPSFSCFSLMAVCAMFASPSSAAVAYIQNCCNHPSTVSVLDTASGHQTAQWTVGSDAFQAVFSPDGKTAYVSGAVSESVTVVEVSNGYVLATLPVGYQISWMAITPDGRTLFAQSYDYAYVSHIVEIDTVTNTLLRAVEFAAVLSPMVVSPDGKKLYVDSTFSSKPGLLVLDTVFLTVQANIPVGPANGLAISPDGRFVYVANLGLSDPYSPNVAVVDTATGTVTANIPIDIKLNPGEVGISPDGSTLWVSEFPLYNNVAPVIVVISTATNQVEDQFTLPGKRVRGPSCSRRMERWRGLSLEDRPSTKLWWPHGRQSRKSTRWVL
jgi:YVTN family beta-propeller protein